METIKDLYIMATHPKLVFWVARRRLETNSRLYNEQSVLKPGYRDVRLAHIPLHRAVRDVSNLLDALRIKE